MSTFWQNILAASSLTVGTVWDLISSPRTGTGSNVYIEQIQSVLQEQTIISTLQDSTITSVATVYDAP